MRKMGILSLVFLVLPLTAFTPSGTSSLDTSHVVKIDASTREERTEITSLGVAIEEIHDTYIVGICHSNQLKDLKAKGFVFETTSTPAFLLDFPPGDGAFHNLQELESEMKALVQAHSNLATISSIGKSVEGRDLWMVRISGTQTKEGEKAGILFLGTHHAREHLSTEVPFFLMKHLLEKYGKDEKITRLVNEREIWIIPLVNPDGTDYDITDKPYKWWRKNRQGGGAQSIYGVDLNRNYGYKWGGQGAGSDPSSETYRGTSAFSEPETQAVKAFIDTHPNITTLLSYHTFSELILYPWGYTYDSIEDQQAFKVHETMAQAMGRMTGYKPQQSSDLYITSGDTTDWSFGEHKIISFTFELYPASIWDGGFYPPASVIEGVTKNNIPPALYLIEYADNPYRVITTGQPRDFLTVSDIWPPKPQ
ncbi:MAG: zinc carboxypeptidase [Deltaproteobacteria bacterium]|nr:zinc carboxypeptidase [Deltaproteobacteria bacterium]MBI3016709.1 zinc carboxypeptidase [Deltaproteobacteria bacterium]